jgi:spermidine/putrescine transport system permease protein
MQDWRENKRFFWGTMLVPTVWFAVFFVVPMAIVWAFSFGNQVGLGQIEITGTFSNYARVFEPEILKIFGQSVWMAALATLICLVAGFPVALKTRAWLLLLIMLPFWTNLLIRTYALITVLGQTGTINDAFALVGLGPFELLYNKGAVITGLVYVHLPFMILPLYAALDRLDKSLIEASLDLGAGHIQTLFKVVVPLAMPGIIAGLIITFIPALGAFLTPDLLGGPNDSMIASLIDRQFKRASDWPFGAAISFILMYLTLLFFALRAVADARAAKMGVK